MPQYLELIAEKSLTSFGVFSQSSCGEDDKTAAYKLDELTERFLRGLLSEINRLVAKF